MLLLGLTDREMTFITEISKGLFPLLAAMTGAYLTYRFQKRDKIRDHLYGYKVKAYSKIAKTIHDIKNNYSYACGDILGNELPLQDYKTPVEVYDLFNNVSSEDALYLTKITLKDIDDFAKKIYWSASLTNKTETDQDLIKREDLIGNYEEMISECDVFISKLQKELKIDKLHESNKTFLETTKNLFNKKNIAP